MKKKPLMLLILGLLSYNTYASDHIDGPLTSAHRVADLTDFYAFPTPNKASSLTMILNTYPLVPESGHFTEKATYAFVIRKAAIAGTKENSKFTTSDEIIIKCNLSTKNDIKKHLMSCRSTNGLAADSIYSSSTPTAGNDFRLYAGMRADPFFFNSKFAIAASNTHVVPTLLATNENAMEDMNILSIVIDIDINKLYPDSPNSLLALATAVYTQDTPQSAVRILDRIGRPEITNVSMVKHYMEEDLRDMYNAERPFEIAAQSSEKYQQRLLSNLKYYDLLDITTDLAEQEKIALSKVLADDYLVLDLNKDCSKDSFLEIERSMLSGESYKTCGGRKLNDDIMDTLFTTYITGLHGTKIQDGVSAPYKAVSTEFPYLASPELGVFAKMKAAAFRLFLKLKD